jgi:26S proteasome regulatory subunit N9
MSAAVSEYLESQKNVHPDLIEHYAEFADLYKKKLWHQLTVKIQSFITLPQFQGTEELVQFYHRFIRDFEMKLNLLTLVQITITISQYITDPRAAMEFMQMIADKVKGDVQAHVLALSVVANMKLRAGLLDECKDTLEQSKAMLEGVAGVDAVVNATHYRVWADYHKARNSPLDFYRSALLYLAYVQVENMPLNEQMALAYDLGIAALIGESTYNFGELLAHPILKSLEGSPAEWLVHLLRVFNSGDIAGYEALVVKYRDQLVSQPALTANQNLLTQKISILALMELAFKRPSDQRTIAFADIATATKLPLNEVEHLVMKALSLKLVRGTIDEVTNTATINWVQPRVLDLAQIAGMKERLGHWTQKVQNTLLFMENETGAELLA